MDLFRLHELFRDDGLASSRARIVAFEDSRPGLADGAIPVADGVVASDDCALLLLFGLAKVDLDGLDFDFEGNDLCGSTNELLLGLLELDGQLLGQSVGRSEVGRELLLLGKQLAVFLLEGLDLGVELANLVRVEPDLRLGVDEPDGELGERSGGEACGFPCGVRRTLLRARGGGPLRLRGRSLRGHGLSTSQRGKLRARGFPP